MPLTTTLKETDKEITLSKGDKTIITILVPHWWSQSTQITAVVNAVVQSGETFRTVNTNDIVRFTMNWMESWAEDSMMFMDVCVSWKEIRYVETA